MSEDRHQKIADNKERARQDSLASAEEGLETDLTESFYEKSDDEYILNKDKTGEEMEGIQFSDAAWSDADKNKIKQRTFEEQSKLNTKEGFAHVSLTDESGRQISTQEARGKHEKDMESLTDEVTDKVMENRQKKKGTKKLGENVYDLSERITAKRKAKEELEKKTEERLKDAA